MSKSIMSRVEEITGKKAPRHSVIVFATTEKCKDCGGRIIFTSICGANLNRVPYGVVRCSSCDNIYERIDYVFDNDNQVRLMDGSIGIIHERDDGFWEILRNSAEVRDKSE